MSEELQKIAYDTTRALAEGGVSREPVLNEATGETLGSEDGPELIVKNQAGGINYHFPSLERLDDVSSGNSGLSLIGFDDTSVTNFSGSNGQAAFESIDSILTSSIALSGDAILKDGSIAFTGDQSLGGNDLTNIGLLGVGNQDPQSELDVTGLISIDTRSQATNPRLYFGHDNFSASTSNYIEVDRTAEEMNFQVNDDVRMILDETSLNVDVPLVIGEAVEYKVYNNGSALKLERLDSGTSATFQIGTADSDGTDNCAIQLYGYESGFDYERIEMGWNPFYGDYLIKTSENGGTARDIRIYAGSDVEQLFLKADSGIGVFNVDPKANFHVTGQDGALGISAPTSTALLAENNGNCYISILGGSTSKAGVYFDSAEYAKIIFDKNTDILEVENTDVRVVSEGSGAVVKVYDGPLAGTGLILAQTKGDDGKITLDGSSNTTSSGINILGLPTSATGLSTGDVWNNSGVLTIV